MKTIKTVTFTMVLFASFLIANMAVAGDEGVERFKPGSLTIAAIAANDLANFSTLVVALDCTNLLDMVANEAAELTVFAPTNAAFSRLSLNETNICSLQPELLSIILLYHVVGERRTSPSVINGHNKDIVMMQGGSVYPDGQGSLVIRDNGDNPVEIIAPDVMASNGVIHVIDKVLLP